MSGIVGIYRSTGQPISPATLTGMVDRVAHRGPDDDGMWVDDSVGLGNTLLYTTPEACHESLPAVDGSLVITADVRLDNRGELLQALGLTGQDSPIPDSHLVLAAYREWGTSCPQHLVGAYAFAIWDREAETLFCARDHFGVKPFYYYHDDGLFAFSSEIKALLALDRIQPHIDTTRVGEHLAGVFGEKTNTFYHDIQRLPPAHTLCLSGDQRTTERYWSLDPSREIHLESDEAYVSRFRTLFTQAVRCRLRSRSPIGSTLSGGLDSSSITCMARELLQDEQPLHTFSAVFDDIPACDERSYIDSVVANGAYESHFVAADQISPLPEPEQLLWHHDEPLSIPMVFMHWGLCRRAADQDIRVLLYGFDGDSVVGYGTSYLPELAWNGHWRRLAAEVSACASRFDTPIRRVMWQTVLKPCLQRLFRPLGRPLIDKRKVVTERNPTINTEFAQQIGLAERLRDIEAEESGFWQPARHHQFQLLTDAFLPTALEVNDRTAAAFSIEPRYPFLDKRLVEFCLALPPDQKIRRGWTRSILRRAMADVLPSKIRQRKGKTNLSPVLIRGLDAFEHDRIQKLLTADTPHLSKYVDQESLRTVCRRLDADGTIDDARTVWRAVTLALWLRNKAKL